MDIERNTNVYSVSFKTPRRESTGGVAAVVLPFRVADNETSMQRPSVYQYTQTEPPGANVHKVRTALGWSMRALADKCRPALDHTTIRRLEHNLGYTQDTLERVAKALNVQVYELFLPPELSEWPSWPDKARARLAESVQEAAIAARYKASAKK